MTNPNFDDQADEKPLDPAMEKVRRKMVRLLIISSSAIILALMAFLGSIVYKVNKNSAAAKQDQAFAPASELVPPPQQSLALPLGFVTDSVSLNGNRLLVSGADKDGHRTLFIYDIGTGKMVSEIAITQN
jgi:hypothetical protein